MSHLKEITKIIKEFALHPEDVFYDKTSGLKIIRRRGYKKIQADRSISIEFELSHSSPESAVVLAKGNMYGLIANPDKNSACTTKMAVISRQTFGEASPVNNKFPYPVSVAQKRAEGRLILELVKLYEKGFYTEDEIDERVKIEARIKEITVKSQASVDETKKALGLI